MNFHSAVIAFSVLGLIAAGDAAAAAKPKANQVCLEDFHKLCPNEELGRGVVIRCARAHHDAVSADCRSAVDAADAADAVNAAHRAAKASKRAAKSTSDAGAS